MPKKPSTPTPLSAILSTDQIRKAIPALERRIAEFTELKLNELTEDNGDNTLDALAQKANATLRDIFGPNTIEYREYKIDSLHGYSGVISFGYNEYDDSF